MERTKYGMVMACLFCILLSQAQDKTEISEQEIKTTGKYIYSWAFENNEASALEIAKNGLLDTIFVSLLKESTIDRTDTIFIKVIDYFIKKVGFKWQAIAFAEKDEVRVKLEERKKMKVIPVIIGTSTGRKVVNSMEEASEKLFITDEQFKNIGIRKPATPAKDLNNPILETLLSLPDARSLENQLVKYSSELRLNYGAKSNYPDDSNCYIFVVDHKTLKITAVLDKGTGERMELLSGNIQKNITERFKEDYFIYVVIN